jgi:hypothetical protein
VTKSIAEMFEDADRENVPYEGLLLAHFVGKRELSIIEKLESAQEVTIKEMAKGIIKSQ